MPNLTPILTDAATLRAKIHAKAASALKSAFPIDLKGRTLELEDVKVHAQEYGPNDQKQKLLTEGSLNEAIKGTLVLKDSQGRTINRAENFLLGHLPYLTERHTLIANGNEYQLANQLRRKPGVYAQRAENGELKSTFNLGRGKNFDLTFNEGKGTFHLAYGTSNIPLYAVLNGLGAKHEDVSKAWGAGVAAANRDEHGHQVDASISKLYGKLAHPSTLNMALDHEAKRAEIEKSWAKTQLDPEVTHATLGHGHDRVTIPALLAASKKLLQIHKGETEVDDVDALTYKTFHAIDDVLAERLGLAARDWKMKARFALNGKTNIREALKPAPFSNSIRKFVTTSSLTAVPTGINPMEILDHAMKVTSLGEGGIPSDRAIPYDARMIHDTHFGALDPIRTPESGHSGVDIRATIAAHRDDAGNLYTVVRDVKTNKEVYLRAGDLAKYVVAFPHQPLSGLVDAFEHGKQTRVPASRVTHQVIHLKHLYSPVTTLIPGIHSIQGNRAIMGSKMGTQALPLVEREAPHVQVMSHLADDVSFERIYGSMITPRAPVAGTIKKIDENWIYIQPHTKKMGEKTAAEALVKVPYQNHFPFPSKTYLHHALHVKAGDKVEEGENMGESNFTRKGTLALGKNLLVGYLPYYGFNSNDAVVISDAASKKLTSEHMYREVYPLSTGLEINKAKHRMYVGAKYTVSQYAQLGEDGVVKKGAKVHPKDILVAGMMKQQITGTDAMLGRISKALSSPYKDVALTWEHGTQGEVIDVVKSGGQIAILVKTLERMQIGDKLCYAEGTDVLTETGWKPIQDVLLTERVAILDGDELKYDYPSATHKYATGGRMYSLETQQVDLLVSETHNMYVKRRSGKAFELIPAKSVWKERVRYRKDANWTGVPAQPVIFPAMQVVAGRHGHGTREMPAFSMAAATYAMLLGMFLSEGNCVDQIDSGSYGIDITQIKEPNRAMLLDALTAAGLKFCEASHHTKVRIYSKQLLEHFKQFGLSEDKYIPNFVFTWDRETLKILFKWLMWGDGNALDGRSVAYTTTSLRLADDVQRLLLHIGYAGNIKSSHKPVQTIKGRTSHNCLRRYDVRTITTKLQPEVNHGHTKTQSGQTESWIPDYQAPIYGLTVPGGVIYVRRNGKSVWSGNSGRYGNKGVVAKIVPDHEMIRDAEGRPIDLLLTSAGVVSRINPMQVIETALGKVAEKTGKPILFDNAAGHNAEAWAQKLLNEHNIKDKEHLYDPVLKRHIKGSDGNGVLVGRQYIYKLFKSTDTNFAGHGVGPYDLNEQPLKTGGDDSAKGLGKMEFDALLAHNARNFLRDAATVRGQKSEEFWKAVQTGMPLPAGKPSFAYNKFLGMLEGAGIRVDKRGSKITLMPLTDKDVLARSTGAIENNKTLAAKNLKPEAGGLFDLRRTGGANGTLYSHIDLHEKMPSPVFQEPVRRLLGLTQAEFDKHLGDKGGSWFHSELSKIDVTKKIAELREKMKKAGGPVLNDLIKQIKYLETLKAHNLTPQDAYMVSKVPVVPPILRPILPMPNDPTQIMVSDPNKLYAHLMDANHTLKNTAIESDTAKHRRELFGSMEALYGTALPLDPKLSQQKTKGFLANIAGVGTPKGGFFQRKLMRRNQDVSGRGTAVPDVNLGMDEIGVPEAMLWGMLDKFLVARLVRKGYSGLDARELVNKKTPAAKQAMMEEVKERPFIFNRAPTLHRFSVLAAYAKPVQGKTLRVNPFGEKGLNLDYDGDFSISALTVLIDSATSDDVTRKWAASQTEVPMSARFKEVVGVKNGTSVYFCHLADFPRHEEISSVSNHITFHKVPDGVEVLSYDAATGRIIATKPSYWSFHKQREVEIATLMSKRQIISDDDERAVYGLNANLEEVRARPSEAVGIHVPVGFGFEDLGETLTRIATPPINRNNAYALKEFIELNERTGRVIGTYVGDGWVSYLHDKIVGTCLANVAPEVTKHFYADLEAEFFAEMPGTYHRTTEALTQGNYGESQKHTVNSTELGRWLAPLIGRGAENKHLPPWYLFTPQAFREGLLAGLLDTDGTVSCSKPTTKKLNGQWMVNYSSTSLRLSQELVWLCRSLGIHAHVGPTKTKAGGPAWQTNISTVDLTRANVPCVHAEKRDGLSRIKTEVAQVSAASSALDMIPIPEFIAAKLSRCCPTSSTPYVLLRKATRTNVVNRALAERVLASNPTLREDVSPLMQRWLQIVDNHAVRWDRVVSYEKTGIVEDGYDLTVPGYETFMNVEGVILSNTLQIHAPITAGGIEDTKKMLLSNLLLADQRKNTLMAFPQHEAIIGFTLAAKAQGKGPVKHFATEEDVIAAYRRGEIPMDALVEIDNKKHAADPVDNTDNDESDPAEGDFVPGHASVLALYPPGSVTGEADEDDDDDVPVSG